MQALEKNLQFGHDQIQREYNGGMWKRVDNGSEYVVSSLQRHIRWIIEERRAQYEAAGDHDDVHADAHAHVPHEHSSLRFQINAARLSNRISGTTADNEEAASER